MSENLFYYRSQWCRKRSCSQKMIHSDFARVSSLHYLLTFLCGALSSGFFSEAIRQCNASFFATLNLWYLQHILMNAALKHYMNPLHVYCRLRDLGMSKSLATFFCGFYERNIFNKLFLNSCALKNTISWVPHRPVLEMHCHTSMLNLDCQIRYRIGGLNRPVMRSVQWGKIMNTKETTIFPFLLGAALVMALVMFLSMLNHEAVALGIYPANSAIALLRFFVF